MAETITLPRSGVVLRYLDVGIDRWILPNGLGGAVFVLDDQGRRGYEAIYCAFGSHRGTRDECIAWLDEQAFTLRAALFPADAREVIAQAMWTHDEWNPHTLAEADVSNIAKVRAGAMSYRALADAVLAALGGKP